MEFYRSFISFPPLPRVRCAAPVNFVAPSFSSCFLKLPNYSHYITTTPTLGGGTLPVTFCCLGLGCSFFVDAPFYFVLNTSFVGCPTTSAQINDIFFSTLSYTRSSCTKFIIRRPLSLEFITISAFADFFDDFPEFLTCLIASIGTKDGKTEKSFRKQIGLDRWEAIETRAIEADLAKDILFSCARTLKVPVTLIFFYFRRKVEAFTNHNILK